MNGANEHLTESAIVVNYLKSYKNIELFNKRTNKHLYWAHDTLQWEVYYFNRRPTWTYKGNNITAALVDFEQAP